MLRYAFLGGRKMWVSTFGLAGNGVNFVQIIGDHVISSWVWKTEKKSFSAISRFWVWDSYKVPQKNVFVTKEQRTKIPNMKH